MRILLFSLILLIGGCNNDPTPTFNEGNRTVSCYVGNKLIAVVMQYEAKSAFDLASARYNRILKRREIRISKEIYNHDVSVVEFAAYHECAHHQLDHVDMSNDPEPRFFWSEEIVKEENDADCLASKIYIKNHGVQEANQMFIELKKSNLLDYKRLIRINNCLK